jgi:hypothetical protein
MAHRFPSEHPVSALELANPQLWSQFEGLTFFAILTSIARLTLHEFKWLLRGCDSSLRQRLDSLPCYGAKLHRSFSGDTGNDRHHPVHR